MKNKIALIGLGNLLMGDEGVGVHALKTLRERYHFSSDLALIDGGTLGLDLLPLLEGREKIIFLDALDRQEDPGRIFILKDEQIPSFLGRGLSFHQVGLADLLWASELIGLKPLKVLLIGIQIEKIETGLALSKALRENFENYIQTILGELAEFEVEFTPMNREEIADVPGRSF